MAAGQGFKTFTTGEVLTATDVNGYLMQGVLVFASATARDAAITSPQEGQFAYTKDTNGLWYYDGAAWVASGATGDIEGVTAGTGISGGGTSGTVTITNSMATAIDAKGDLIAGTGADAFSRLAVGTNNYVLTADSTAATGIKWGAPPSATRNYTLLNAGGTSMNNGTSTITISSIGGYDNYFIVAKNPGSQGASANEYRIRFNGDSSTKYNYRFIQLQGTTTNGWSYGEADNAIYAGRTQASAGSALEMVFSLEGASQAGIKPLSLTSSISGTTSTQMNTGWGWYEGTSAITSVSFITSGTNFNGGTVYVYGA